MHRIDIPSTADKEQKFKALLLQIESLVSSEPDLITNLSNIAAAIKEGCGYFWEHRKMIVVPDVEKYPGHIACNAASKSEIVLPVVKNGEVIRILDVDSEVLDDFDQVDQWLLRAVVEIVSRI